MIRVLVVDDSAFMRRGLTTLLEQDPEIKVVGTARDGQEALEKARELEIDAMTLDVEMPRLNGIETLRRLMSSNPVPVLMVSSLTESGAECTLKAMELGALDFIPKTMSNDNDAFGRDLRQKIKAIARKKSLVRLMHRHAVHGGADKTPHLAADKKPPLMQAHRPAPQRAPARCCHLGGHGPRDLIVIGVSTGGPPVVQSILSALPADLPACILIAQHMPATFTGPFAKRLDTVSQLSVSEAVDGDKLKNGHAYVCPGGKHIGIRMRGALPEVAITTEPRDALYKPTVNVLMETAGNHMGRRTLGVMLTGMGSDGVDGARVLREKGGLLLAQSEESCVVYGMPKAVIDADLANQILAAEDIPTAILAAVRG